LRKPNHILPTIVISQFCCTSLWFASNAVMPELIEIFQLPSQALGTLTSIIQFGFITGTLLFALLNIADRFLPSNVFFVCAIIGALLNFAIIWQHNTYFTLLTLRFGTGFCLAGIYPVGMKIAADYYEKGLGKSLGFLVGALVLGTAFPHAIKGFNQNLDWKSVIIFVSIASTIGGLLMKLFVPAGPFRRAIPRIHLSAFFQVFSNKNFRTAAFGYFGHMWELYTFWALIPLILTTYKNNFQLQNFNISFWSFLIIAIGGIGCAISGKLSLKYGAKVLATIALVSSGFCCILSPFIFNINFTNAFLIVLLFWGLMVVADSPLFSTLVANNAVPEIKGTALTIVNCIGFSITIISIQLISWVSDKISSDYLFVLLSIGPIFGVYNLLKNKFLK